jgi:hypothetical protein
LVVVPISLLVVVVRLVTVLDPTNGAVVVTVILVVIDVIISIPLAVVIMLAVIRLLSVLALVLVICNTPWLVLSVLSVGLIGLRVAVGRSPAHGVAFRRISPAPLVGGRV